MANITWKFQVDWYDDGFNADSDISSYVKTASWNLGLNDEFELVAGESNLELLLNNVDKRFSPEGTAGPYYGSVLPHRKVRVQSISSLGTITHWTGWLERISPEPGALRNRTARLTATGAKKYLEDRQIYSPLLTDITADIVIGTVIKQSREWPPGLDRSFILDHPTKGILGTSILADNNDGLSLQTGQTTFPYVGDGWDDGISAMKAIADLVRGERGRFFFDRGGTAVFWDRKYIANNIQSNSGTVNSEWYNLNYDYGDNIVNRAIVTVYPRSIGTATDNVLWQLDEPFELKNQQKKNIRVRFTDSNSDLKVSSDPDTCNYSAAWTPNSTYIRTKAEFTSKGGNIEFHNTALYSFVTVTSIVVTGIKRTEHQQLEVIEDNEESIAKYGLRDLRIDTSTMANEDDARSIAQYEASRRATPQGFIKSIGFRGRADNLTQSLQWKTGTRIKIIDSQIVHNQDYIILGEEHALTNSTKTHDITYLLLPAARHNYFVLDSSLLDGNDKLFV